MNLHQILLNQILIMESKEKDIHLSEDPDMKEIFDEDNNDFNIEKNPISFNKILRPSKKPLSTQEIVPLPFSQYIENQDVNRVKNDAPHELIPQYLNQISRVFPDDPKIQPLQAFVVQNDSTNLNDQTPYIETNALNNINVVSIDEHPVSINQVNDHQYQKDIDNTSISIKYDDFSNDLENLDRTQQLRMEPNLTVQPFKNLHTFEKLPLSDNIVKSWQIASIKNSDELGNLTTDIHRTSIINPNDMHRDLMDDIHKQTEKIFFETLDPVTQKISVDDTQTIKLDTLDPIESKRLESFNKTDQRIISYLNQTFSKIDSTKKFEETLENQDNIYTDVDKDVSTEAMQASSLDGDLKKKSNESQQNFTLTDISINIPIRDDLSQPVQTMDIVPEHKPILQTYDMIKMHMDHLRPGDLKSIYLTLNPKELGNVHIHLRSDEQGNVHTTLSFENSETFNLFQGDIMEIKHILKEIGMNESNVNLQMTTQDQEKQQQNSNNPEWEEYTIQGFKKFHSFKVNSQEYEAHSTESHRIDIQV